MKILFGIAGTGLLTFLLLDNFPWWTCGIIAFIVTLALRLKSGSAFLAGFLGVALSWGIATGWIDSQNASQLSRKIGDLFGGLSPYLLIGITALIGGLIGGFGGMTGGILAQLVFKHK